jgi:hypothetical protein
MKGEDKQWGMRTERSLARRMYGVSHKDRQQSGDLLKCLGIMDVDEIMDSSALRWLGHVERKRDLDWVSN